MSDENIFSQPKSSSGSRWALSRRVRLSPRLAILYALPFLGLAAVAFALNYGQWQNVRAVDRYEDRVIGALHSLELVDALSHERHAGFEIDSAEAIEPAIEVVNTLAAQLGRADVEQLLLTDRNTARSGRFLNTDTYRSVIDDVVSTAERTLTNAPTESTATESSAHIALVRATEAAHLEDLLIRGNRLPFDQAVVRELGELHQIETSELQSATLRADPVLSRQIVAVPFGPIWRSTIELRNSIVDGTGGATQAEWAATNAPRLQALDALVDEHALVTLERVRAERSETQRNALVTSLLTAFVALLAALSFRLLRSSLLGPIMSLRGAIGSLIRGELQPHEATGADEMGEVEESLVELERVMALLKRRSDDVQAEIATGNVSARIDTAGFSGYWLDRVAAQNQALDAMERAVVDASDAEELRRWIASMHHDAELSETVDGFISRTCSHLNISGPEVGLEIEPVEPDWFFRPQQNVRDEVIIDAESGPDKWRLAVPLGMGTDQAEALVAVQHEPWADQGRVMTKLAAISRALSQISARLEREQAEIWSRTHDRVTALPNRRGLEQQMVESATAGRDVAWMICVGPVDLDLFGEGFGVNQRSEVLVAFARRLKVLVSDDVSLSRISETEYTLLGHDEFPLETILELTRAFDRPILIDGGSVRVDAAIGWAHTGHGVTGTELIDASRVAYRSSADRRPVMAVEFTPEMRHQAARSFELRKWLQSSLDAQTLEVWYQPIAGTSSGEIVGYEALCRGFDKGEMVSPAEFIPVAEQTGLIDRIADFVIEAALRNVEWLPGKTPYVAVNLSPLQLRDPDIVSRISRSLSENDIDPSRLVLEITEGAVVDDDPSVLERLDGLNALGLTLAIDDFGTGYSSLAYLSQLPVKTVKIDRSLIDPLGKDPSAAKVVARTVELAHDLGMSIVAEGVETVEQLDHIAAIGADSYQGWYFGRPQPLTKILEHHSSAL